MFIDKLLLLLFNYNFTNFRKYYWHFLKIVVLNELFQAGEQFNFKYQTECDGEVIMHLYNHGGAEFAAQHLDGVFAFCLLDTRAKRIYIGRDTFGVRPCFRLFLENGFLAICSEAKGTTLLKMGKVVFL